MVAQSVNYVDESGNIFFVDSIDQVPLKFRAQVVPPTPTPDLKPREFRKHQSELKKIEKEKIKAKKLKEKEKKEKMKLLQKKKKKQIKDLLK